MPAAPELCDTLRNKRIIEILPEIKAEYSAESDCHIAVAGKIKIHMKSICRGVKPEKQHRFVIGLPEYAAQLAKQIGNQNFFPKSQDKAAHPGRRLLRRVPALLQLLCDIRIPDNGTCDQLRKESDIRRKVNEVLLRANRSSVNIREVAQDLKGIEADSDGKRNLQKRHGQACRCIEIADKEIRVFEISQHGKAEGNGKHKKCPCQTQSAAKVFDQKTGQIGCDNGKQHPEDINRLSPAVEKQTGKKQGRILQPPGCGEIKKHHAGQKPV